MNCQPQQQNANLFIAFSLEMVKKLFAILIHGDESDYAVNGPRNKKMRFPSPLIYRGHNSTRHEFNR